jgi:hypothetical protein
MMIACEPLLLYYLGMGVVTFDQHELEVEKVEVESQVKMMAIFKVMSLFVVILALFGYLVFYSHFGSARVNQVSMSDSFGKVEYRVPYKNTLYDSFGFVQEPRVMLPMKTTSGYQDINFLLDSGAVVSALPLTAAKDTGVNLSKAKRITLQGFSGMPAFAYLDVIVVKIADTDYEFPAVFTESEKTTYILGRKGFFDDFSINFDHENRMITISRKK